MKANETRRILGVTQRTLNNYIKNGILHPLVINSHHYEYDRDEVYSLIRKPQERINVTYARVSLPKQKNDLKTQNERLYDFALRNGYTLSKQIEDVKSGMAFAERKGFMKLINLVVNNQVDNVIVENRDRLVRFGFDLLKEVFQLHGTKIVVMSETENKSYEQELTDDLISIIHYYSMKSYSNRRRLHNAEKALSEKDND
jgi:predicted site-specific integrase-resolvase